MSGASPRLNAPFAANDAFVAKTKALCCCGLLRCSVDAVHALRFAPPVFELPARAGFKERRREARVSCVGFRLEDDKMVGKVTAVDPGGPAARQVFALGTSFKASSACGHASSLPRCRRDSRSGSICSSRRHR